jgi:AraC family transcriptional regulator
MIEPKLTTIPVKKIVGVWAKMSLLNNRTPFIWKTFMSRRSEVSNAAGTTLINLRNYPLSYDFNKVDLSAEFDKWAGIEVSDHDHVPEGMSAFTIPPGLYAVFHYKGSSGDEGIYRYIYGEWLPKSGYEIDSRPHFEMLGEKYKNNDPASEEDLWIPLKLKL